MARRSGGGSFGSFVMSLLWTAVLLVVAGGMLAVWEFHRAGPNAETKTFVVERGAGVSAIGAALERDGLIRSRHAFRVAAALYANAGALKAGEYEVAAAESLRGILEKIESGKSRLFSLTVPEGRTSAVVVQLIAEATFLTGETPETPPEGAILPETYFVERGMDRSALLARMMADRDKVLADLWAKRAANLPVKTPEEAVILASIVEKETGVASERPRVAAVFTNRLNKGMRLQSDPTIIYGECQCAQLRDSTGKPRGIRRSEIDRRSPYNTYQIDGLPPGPIANPGREAIAAVLNPPTTDDLFFVALDPEDPSKGHVFSATNAEHEAAVLRFREAEKALKKPAP